MTYVHPEDRRHLLRIKAKEMAAESRIIRAEEHKFMNRGDWGFKPDIPVAPKGDQVIAARQARLIRRQLRARYRNFALKVNGKREEMYLHRVGIVRRISRNTHLARMLIKGVPYAHVERVTYTRLTENDVASIAAMVASYGPLGLKAHSEAQRELANAQARELVQHWLKTPEPVAEGILVEA